MNFYSCVYDIGTSVLLQDDIHAKINAIMIRSGCIQYEVVWWSSNTRNTAWVEEHEVSPMPTSTKSQIGFRDAS